MADPIRLPDEAVAAAERGNKIEAIKIVRDRTGLGLKEAKEAVEAHVGTTAPGSPKEDQGGRTLVAIVVAAVVAAAIYMLR